MVLVWCGGDGDGFDGGGGGLTVDHCVVAGEVWC